MIAEVKPRNVLENSRRTLGLPLQGGNSSGLVDDAFLAALLRHSAGFLCPCSVATLRFAAINSLQHLVDDEDLVERIEEGIEALTSVGDLLELSHVTTDDPAVRGTWLFAAPPSYVVRPSGSIFLIGIVADQDTYLPLELTERIQYEGYVRMIVPRHNEDLAEELAELGLQRLSQDNWLKRPREQSASKLYKDFQAKLRSAPRSGSIPDLQLLDSERPATYYRGRWVEVKKQSGMFMGRRPQEYGSPIWCFVEVQGGEAKKLLDFPLPKNRWRGCDAAWHLQMAIDHLRGTPQCYKLRQDAEGICLDFFSPLPLWAQRRLMTIGRKVAPEKCLLSYRIPERELEEEERFLQEQLWLARQDQDEEVGE